MRNWRRVVRILGRSPVASVRPSDTQLPYEQGYYNTFVLPLADRAIPRQVIFSGEYEHRSLGEDRAILERLVEAYHCAIERAPAETRSAMHSDVWGVAGHNRKQAALIRSLEERDFRELHRILSRFFVTREAHGLSCGDEVAALYRANPSKYGLLWLDRLSAFAFCSGALPMPNPEEVAERYRSVAEPEADEAVAAIEKWLGVELVFPDICGVFGGAVAGRAFPDYAFLHLLTAANLRQLANVSTPTILEIGGGYGGLAYFTLRLMPCRYRIYDLPFVSAVQGYFLHRALPGCKFALCGEDIDASVDCTLLPAWDLLRERLAIPVDLAVNTDSLPEMPCQLAVEYLTALRPHLRGPLFSINQEGPAGAPGRTGRASVAQLVEACGGYRRFHRSPFFLRRGYVQEIYYAESGQT